MGLGSLTIRFKAGARKAQLGEPKISKKTPCALGSYLSEPKALVEQSLWYGHSPQCVYRIPHPYCTHFLSVHIDDTLTHVLSNLRHFERRVRETMPLKAKAKQRLVAGIAECLRFIKTKGSKLVMLVVAVDVEEIVTRAAGWRELLCTARALEKPVVFGLTRKELTGLMDRKGCTTSVIGIINADGAFDKVKSLLDLLLEAKTVWRDAAVSLLQEDLERSSGTFLSLLALNGHDHVIQSLVSSHLSSLQAVVNHVDGRSGKTPLMMAAHGQSLEIVSLFLTLGGDPVRRDFLGCSSFHYAVASGNVEILKHLMQSCSHRSVDSLETRNFSNKSCLDIAIEDGSVEMCRTLVEFGVTITLIHIAKTIRTPRPLVELFHFLFRSVDHLTSCDLAHVLAYISSTGETNYWRGLKGLLFDKYNLSQQDISNLLDDQSYDGLTCAWRAANLGHRAMAKMLLALGCDVSFRPDKLENGKSIIEMCK